MRFIYHQHVPNFYKIDNPANPMNSADDDFFAELNKAVLNEGFVGISYSEVSDEFKDKLDIEWDNILILKYLMSEDILKMKNSKEKTVLEDAEFQEFGVKAFKIADFLRKNNFKANLIHPLDDRVSLRAIALESNDCVITRNNMCMFREALNIGFFMIETSIGNLPLKSENDMLWVSNYCSGCGVCIDRCPVNAFDDNEKVKRKVCIAHSEGCSRCMTICPFFKQGYDKVKRRYDRSVG